MRINIDDAAFSDPRFKLLGGQLGITWQEALGRCLPVWSLAYTRRSVVLRAGDIDALAERPGFAAAMMIAELASEEPDGVYLCGVTERIDFLIVQDAKREKARQAKARAAGVKLPPGRSRGKSRGRVPGEDDHTASADSESDGESDSECTPEVPTSSEVPGDHPGGPSRGTIPGEGPYSLALAPDLALALAPDPPALARAIPPSTEYDADSEEDRAELAHRTYTRVSAARVAIAAELGMPEQLPFPEITPSTRPQPFRELSERIREEGALAPRACDKVVKSLVEQARTERSVEWLSLKAFSSGAWTNARDRIPGQRAGPRSAARPPGPKRFLSTEPDDEPDFSARKP